LLLSSPQDPKEFVMRLFAIAVASLLSMPASLAAQQPAPAAVAVAAADPGDEIVCRKVKETGSLVKARRTCHTKAEWHDLDEQHQRASRQLVQDNTSRVGGN
jgi:hypothetical protein